MPVGPVAKTTLALPRAQVLVLVGELRSHKPWSMTKKKKRRKFCVDMLSMMVSSPSVI